jgi:hypothetical protein
MTKMAEVMAVGGTVSRNVVMLVQKMDKEDGGTNVY